MSDYNLPPSKTYALNKITPSGTQRLGTFNGTSIPFSTSLDPLSVLLPTSVYLKLVEKLHPHEPAIKALEAITKQLSTEERAFVQARLKTFNEYADAVEKTIGGQAAKKSAA